MHSNADSVDGIQTELYVNSLQRLPVDGQHLIGYQTDNSLIVYQAYKKSIADFAVANQWLGGPEFSYNRMSWIKPNFLWMMFRCGWTEKENQEAVLAITISKRFLMDILKQSVISSFDSRYFATHEMWKEELNRKEVRLQWDPDHDPFGNKLSRRAIQLGLKGDLLHRYGTQEVQRIQDITPFVREQKKILDARHLNKLLIPFETIIEIPDTTLAQQVGL